MLHEGRLLRIAAPQEAITAETMHLLYRVEVEIVSVGGGMKACVPRG